LVRRGLIHQGNATSGEMISREKLSTMHGIGDEQIGTELIT